MKPRGVLRAVLAAVPVVMLTFAVPLANHTQPRILGFPFLMAWIVAWVVVTPVFLYGVDRLRRSA